MMLEITADLLIEEGKKSLEVAFEKYKYWLQFGPESYAKKFKINTDEKGCDWRAFLIPFCEYYPEKELIVLTDPSGDFGENENKESFAQRCKFHEISYWFFEGDLPIEIHVETLNGQKNCCRDPIEWFIYLCKVALQRKKENTLFNIQEIDFWKEIITWLFEKIQTDIIKKPKAKKEYIQNKSIIFLLKEEIFGTTNRDDAGKQNENAIQLEPNNHPDWSKDSFSKTKIGKVACNVGYKDDKSYRDFVDNAEKKPGVRAIKKTKAKNRFQVNFTWLCNERTDSTKDKILRELME